MRPDRNGKVSLTVPMHAGGVIDNKETARVSLVSKLDEQSSLTLERQDEGEC